MSAKTNYLENAILNHVLRKGANNMTSPTNLYVALHTADPGEDATTGEVSGNGYARQSVSFNAASGGQSSHTALLTFQATGGNWGSITHASLWDASTAGNPLYYGALASAKTINNGDKLEFPAGNVVVAEA